MAEARIIIVRHATATDAAVIAGMINAAFAQYLGRLKPNPGALAETAETIAPQLARPGGGAVALCANGAGGPPAIAGAVLFKPEDNDLYFGRLAVPPDRRGHGVAGALIRFVEDEARRRDCAGIVLGVRIVLPENQSLFARHGFAEISRHAHEGYTEPTWIKMRKPLSSSRFG
ncbi:MAG TPA: GNAT family N-acetyltransferase [Vineibacter sp.]|nr:GNAT family N-acetyltransferase [Vineibacter sp.]